jgi:protease-4
MVLALVLLVLFGLSFLFNLQQFASSLVPGAGPRYTRAVGPKLQEVLVEDNDSPEKIAVIEISGIISSQMMDPGGFGMVDIIKAEFRRAQEDRRVRAVILDVNSPGGEVLAADEISRIIMEFQEQSDKPVVAAMRDMAASGGYYVSAPCRWIVANELTITGSIGVILSTYNFRNLMNKVGIRPEVYKSGKYKDMLSWSRDPDAVTPEERQMLDDLVQQTYRKFKSVVLQGRTNAGKLNAENGRPLSEDWADYADGRILSGKDAFELGFVDELGAFETAVSRAAKLARITQANVVKYQPHYDLGDLLRLFGKSDRNSLKLDLGIDPPKLQAGMLYFLAPTFIQ